MKDLAGVDRAVPAGVRARRHILNRELIDGQAGNDANFPDDVD